MRAKKPSVWIIFLTVFIDLVGFGIVIPLLPLYAKNFNASGWEIGALMAAFSLMQFVSAPLLGRLSDKVGRKPVLLTSTAGAALSYALFAAASGLSGNAALVLVFVSRAVAGICGANIVVAQAYIADVTEPAQRSKKMGLIGMAFGLGFIFGPYIGGEARALWGIMGPGIAASVLCALNFALAWFVLPESWTPQNKAEKPAAQSNFGRWRQALRQPKVGLLIWIFFLTTFSFSSFETTLGLFVMQKFGISFTSAKGVQSIANIFMFVGIVAACVQGGLTGRLVKALGEPRLIVLSLTLTAIAFGCVPLVGSWGLLYGVLTVLAMGASLTRPPVFGMISNLTKPEEQGATLGVAQGMGSLSRIFGPIFAATLFFVNADIPYQICAGLLLAVACLALARLVSPPQGKS